ncbi:MAG: hypothetical protein HYT98_00710 [Candidatus Sungbacteria bacterium]|nr:hypothetical protein [Candidatus Sungbacteria bacterium]
MRTTPQLMHETRVWKVSDDSDLCPNPFINKEFISLEELCDFGWFNDAVWCCIRNAVIPEDKAVLESVGKIMGDKCRAMAEEIVKKPEFKRGYEFADYAIKQVENGNSFQAIVHTFLAYGLAAREELEKDERYIKHLEASRNFVCLLEARAGLLEQEIKDVSGLESSPWWTKVYIFMRQHTKFRLLKDRAKKLPELEKRRQNTTVLIEAMRKYHCNSFLEKASKAFEHAVEGAKRELEKTFLAAMRTHTALSS